MDPRYSGHVLEDNYSVYSGIRTLYRPVRTVVSTRTQIPRIIYSGNNHSQLYLLRTKSRSTCNRLCKCTDCPVQQRKRTALIWQHMRCGRIVYVVIIIIIHSFFHGLGRMTRSGIDALPSLPRASTISSSSRFVFE